MTKWVCTICGYETEGVAPPAKCPTCGAEKDAFEIMEEREVNERGEEVASEDEWEEDEGIEYDDIGGDD